MITHSEGTNEFRPCADIDMTAKRHGASECDLMKDHTIWADLRFGMNDDPCGVGEAQAAADPGHASDHQLASFPIEYSEGADVGYRWYEKTRATPLFPFGHGLSYTSFAYRNPVVKGGAKLSISFEVVNTGRVAGADVPQMYVSRDGASAPMRLAAFRRVTLKPGESARVTLVAEPRILADYDPTLPGWRVTGGRYRVALAHDARDRALVSTATVTAATMKP